MLALTVLQPLARPLDARWLSSEHEYDVLQPALDSALRSKGGNPACSGPPPGSFWVVGTHHKTGTVLFDAVMHQIAGWGVAAHGGTFSSTNTNDPAAKACVHQSGYQLGPEITAQQQQQADAGPVLEVPDPMDKKGNNSMHNNFYLDDSCMERVRKESNVLRLRVMKTTQESWPLQLEAYQKATDSAALKVVHSVRDPLDIIISGYFYDVAGSEPECRAVPSVILADAKRRCGEHQGEVCLALKKLDEKHMSWSDALQKIPPRLGVLAEAFEMYSEIEVEAETAAALKAAALSDASSFAHAYQVDLGEVMSSFDSTMGGLFTFLGMPQPLECVQAIKELDISASRAASSFTSCISAAKANGTDVGGLEAELETLRERDDIVREEGWHNAFVAPIEKAIPTACLPCGAQSSSCHLASGALDALREKVRNALKQSDFFKERIAPLRATLGYH